MSASGKHESEGSKVQDSPAMISSSPHDIIGVQLINDNKTDSGTNLGIILLPSTGTQGPSVADLRQLIEAQIVACPSQYSVCSKQGWPIIDAQEKSLTLPQILTDRDTISIQVKYDHPKLGIKNQDGEVIGFVRANYSSKLKSIKQLVFQQVLEPLGYPQTFYFLDGSSWPISSVQEHMMAVADAMIDSCVMVKASNKRKPSQDFSPPKLPPDKKFKEFKETKQLSFRSGKDVYRSPTADSLCPSSGSKQVLISYVRAEAANHALLLKEELSALGLSVYLDVHEIKTGVDWQDSLNFAVSGCEVFVPLVTLKYGLTQWTNREVKLADVLGKYIIPVNFLLEWPPRCLAIQFASTQFIPWIPPDELNEEQGTLSDLSSKTLDMSHLRRVATRVADRVRSLNLTSVPTLMKRATIVKSCAMVTEDNSMATRADREGKPLVVICLHPAEQQHGVVLSQVLEKEGFEVWCTTELDRKHLDHIDGLGSSQEGENYLVSLGQGCYGEEGRRCIQEFRERADDASVVLCVLSHAFSKSRTCQQQVFYCEHRKRTIHIMYEDFKIPEWMAMLIGSQGFQLRKDEDYMDLIIRKVRTVTERSAAETNGSSQPPLSDKPSVRAVMERSVTKTNGSSQPPLPDSPSEKQKKSESDQESPSAISPGQESPVKRPSLASMKTLILP